MFQYRCFVAVSSRGISGRGFGADETVMDAKKHRMIPNAAEHYSVLFGLLAPTMKAL
jgi:hypothetical protein